MELNIYTIEEYDGPCGECSGGWEQLMLSHEKKFTQEEFDKMVTNIEESFKMTNEIMGGTEDKFEFLTTMMGEMYGFKPFKPYMQHTIG